jgi:aminopeptidase
MAPVDIDARWGHLGDLLVKYSARVKPGERVMIAMGEIESLPLVQAVYVAVIRAGGLPQVQFLSEMLRHALLEEGNAEQLTWVPEIEAYGMQWADVYFGLRGAFDLDIHRDIGTERLSLNQAAAGKISSLRWQNTRWCLVRVPNQAFARQAGVDYDTILDMFFNACLIDWDGLTHTWQSWAGRLNQGRHVRLVGKETDLQFSTQGRTWVIGDGRNNMPDGEINTAPVEGTLDGFIYFEFPGVLSGRLMQDIRLRWAVGRLVEATSSTNQDFLRSILATDAGASLIGEFALGTNPFINLFCKDILIDEKIGGTVHIAMGRAYPECGGTNQSAIHWDIIKDTRSEGAVYVDDRLVLHNGHFLF